jgi:trehalose/maltose hydrolase-like predicted phosphorylase
VIREVPRFWASRITYDAPRHRNQFVIVNPVAESHADVRNDKFTNLVARKVCAIAAARASDEKADLRWRCIARELYIPIDDQAHHCLPFDPSIVAHSEDFGRSPLALLFVSSLDLQLTLC